MYVSIDVHLPIYSIPYIKKAITDIAKSNILALKYARNKFAHRILHPFSHGPHKYSLMKKMTQMHGYYLLTRDG